MEIKYKSNPNYRRPLTTAKIMAYLLVALLVASAFGLFNAYNLGGMALLGNAVLLMAVAVAVTLVTEAVWAKVLKQDIKKLQDLISKQKESKAEKTEVKEAATESEPKTENS